MSEVQVVLAQDWLSELNKKRGRAKKAVVEVYRKEDDAKGRMDELIEQGYDRVVRIPREVRT